MLLHRLRKLSFFLILIKAFQTPLDYLRNALSQSLDPGCFPLFLFGNLGNTWFSMESNVILWYIMYFIQAYFKRKLQNSQLCPLIWVETRSYSVSISTPL